MDDDQFQHSYELYDELDQCVKSFDEIVEKIRSMKFRGKYEKETAKQFLDIAPHATMVLWYLRRCCDQDAG